MAGWQEACRMITNSSGYNILRLRSLSFRIPAHQLGEGRQDVLIFEKNCINRLGDRHLYAVAAAQFPDGLGRAHALGDAAGLLEDVAEPAALAALLADA